MTNLESKVETRPEEVSTPIDSGKPAVAEVLPLPTTPAAAEAEKTAKLVE